MKINILFAKVLSKFDKQIFKSKLKKNRSEDHCYEKEYVNNSSAKQQGKLYKKLHTRAYTHPHPHTYEHIHTKINIHMHTINHININTHSHWLN